MTGALVKRVYRTRIYDRLYRGLIRWKIRRSDRAPRILYLEATNVCNAKCVFCPRDEMERPQGFMEIGLFRRIVDQAAEAGVPELRLHNFGETTLDRQFLERVEYAKSKGMPKVGLYSNASRLFPALSEKLVAAGLDAVWISVDGATRESYEAIRVGLSFDVLMANVRGLAEAKRRAGSARPFVTITMTHTPGTAREAGDLERVFRGLADRVVSGPAHVWTYRHGSPDPVARYACPYLWTALYVLWDGRASICCEDFDGRVILGDLRAETLLEVWRGERYRRAREAHLAGRWEELPICATCPVTADSHDRWLWWNP